MNDCQCSECEIIQFLEEVDKNFLVPLSERQNLDVLANKLFENGSIFARHEDDRMIAMVAGYINSFNGIAYISVVATLPSWQGRGIATELIKEFIEEASRKGMKAVHLYTNKNVEPMYRKIGFVSFYDKEEKRPEDVHLIMNM